MQATSGIDPVANGDMLVTAVAEAAAGGAAMLFTPEMSGLIDGDATRAARHVVAEADDPVLARVRAAAAEYRIWVHVGSLALLAADEVRREDARWANRGFVIDAAGTVVARYDKQHLFDVDLASGERWRESARYRPGDETVVVDTPVGCLGLSICYDLRFPALYQALSAHGAVVIAVPAAFTIPTGQAHWHTLLRARAIENAAFVVAAAQVGTHADGRATYGHSLVVDPWGDVLLDCGETPGLAFCELDPAQVEAVRARVSVIAHRRAIPIPSPVPPPIPTANAVSAAEPLAT